MFHESIPRCKLARDQSRRAAAANPSNCSNIGKARHLHGYALPLASSLIKSRASTGHKWTRAEENGQDVKARETDWPSIGSVVEYLSAHETTRQRTFPDYVYLPNRLGHLQIPKYDRTGRDADWLGSAYNGLSTEIRPLDPKDNMWLHAAKEEELDFRIKGLVPTTEVSLNRRDQALELVTSDTIRNVLDIRREKPELRDVL